MADLGQIDSDLWSDDHLMDTWIYPRHLAGDFTDNTPRINTGQLHVSAVSGGSPTNGDFYLIDELTGYILTPLFDVSDGYFYGLGTHLKVGVLFATPSKSIQNTYTDVRAMSHIIPTSTPVEVVFDVTNPVAGQGINQYALTNPQDFTGDIYNVTSLESKTYLLYGNGSLAGSVTKSGLPVDSRLYLYSAYSGAFIKSLKGPHFQLAGFNENYKVHIRCKIEDESENDIFIQNALLNDVVMDFYWDTVAPAQADKTWTPEPVVLHPWSSAHTLFLSLGYSGFSDISVNITNVATPLEAEVLLLENNSKTLIERRTGSTVRFDGLRVTTYTVICKSSLGIRIVSNVTAPNSITVNFADALTGGVLQRPLTVPQPYIRPVLPPNLSNDLTSIDSSGLSKGVISGQVLDNKVSMENAMVLLYDHVPNVIRVAKGSSYYFDGLIEGRKYMLICSILDGSKNDLIVQDIDKDTTVDFDFSLSAPQNYFIEGVIRKGSSELVGRTVILMHRATREVVEMTTSDPTTGEYRFNRLYSDNDYVVVALPDKTTDPNYHASIKDLILPFSE